MKGIPIITSYAYVAHYKKQQKLLVSAYFVCVCVCRGLTDRPMIIEMHASQTYIPFWVIGEEF